MYLQDKTKSAHSYINPLYGHHVITGYHIIPSDTITILCNYDNNHVMERTIQIQGYNTVSSIQPSLATGLKSNHLKVESFDQSAVCNMSLMCTTFLSAAKLDALLTEYALNVSVSMPTSANISLISVVTGACGFT